MVPLSVLREGVTNYKREGTEEDVRKKDIQVRLQKMSRFVRQTRSGVEDSR